MSAPGDRPGAARARRDGGHAEPAAALPRARTSRSATTSTTPGPTSPSTSPSPTRRAARSARCSTRPAQQFDPSNDQRTGVTALGAAYPANGGTNSSTVQYLHSNNYSAAIDRAGNADCESGQRGYVERINAFGAPEAKTVVDPHLPGNSGTTWTGRPRVPAGQTFSRAPEVGPADAEGAGPVRRGHGPVAEGRPARARRDRDRRATSASRRPTRSPTASSSRPPSGRPTTSRPGSPVRIAGVNVGKVTGVEASSRRRDRAHRRGAIVHMEIEKAGLPIKTDARMKVRPRIFLEGNCFVDLSPGSPSAPALPEGGDAPGPADERAGAVRAGPHRAAVRHAPGPADRARRVRARARQGRRARLQPLDRVLDEGVPRLGDRQRGDARHRAARPQRLHRGAGALRPRPRPRPAGARRT